MKQHAKRGGFTLIELLLVIGIIAILAAIVIVAINPTKQLADARNAQRRSDVTTILNALYQYSIDNNGNFPTGTLTGTTMWQICNKPRNTTIGSCGYASVKGADLSALTTGGKYLVAIPFDPKIVSPTTATGAGYWVGLDTNGRLTVSAPTQGSLGAENGATISVTR